MDQFGTALPGDQGEKQPFGPEVEQRAESQLLHKVRNNFGVFGSISLTFGILFTLLFYKADIGINSLIFTIAMVMMLYRTIMQLSLKLKTGTTYYYAGAILLGASTFMTANETIWFLNTIGILLLLDLSLLHQFYDDSQWDFLKHFLRMLALPFVSIAAIGMPFMDCFGKMKKTRAFKNEKVRNIFIGILISIPFLWIIILLLINADLLFDSLTRDVVDAVFQGDIYAVLFMVLFGFLVCYCIICAAVGRVGLPEKAGIKKADASIAATVLLILTLVYLVFCTIQVVYLFAGGLFVLPEGYTFAEYARRGFFELLAVAVINVTLMVLCRSLFEESKLLRIVITVMTVCTYIMIASATYRMLLYIDAYHLTFLRVFVLLSLLIIALVLAGVIIAQYQSKFPLFRYCVAVTSLCYIAFSISRPDYYIAEYLIAHTEQLDQEDLSFLIYETSIDAAPVVIPVLKDTDRFKNYIDKADENYDTSYQDYGTMESMVNDYYDKVKNAGIQSIRDFNYSNYLAEESLKND